MIYLHIGTHKTGTSSIQSFFYSNEKLLRREKLLYPLFSKNHSGPLCSAVKDNPLTYFYYKKHKNFTNSKIIDENERIKSEIRKNVTEKKYNNIIFSGEELSFLSLSEVYRLKELLSKTHHEIKIIIYKRDSEDYFLSAFQQHLKAGLSYREIKRNPPKYIFEEAYKNFSTVFKTSNIIVRDFNSCKNDVVSDFIKTLALKINNDSNELNEIHENTSLGLYSCFLLNAYNILKLPPPIKLYKTNEIHDIKFNSNFENLELWDLGPNLSSKMIKTIEEKCDFSAVEVELKKIGFSYVFIEGLKKYSSELSNKIYPISDNKRDIHGKV